jgi:hypothetical protein
MSKLRSAEQREHGQRGRWWLAIAGSGVLGVGLCLVAATPAGAATATVNNQSQLQSALPDTTNDTVVLGANISITDGSNVVVSSSLAKTLDLNGHSLSISSVGSDDAAVELTGAASLTIKDSVGGGSLTATGGSNGAGIGGSNTEGGGALSLQSGLVTATGGTEAAGVGGGAGGNGGSVTVSGGLLTATGGADGAGVGGGKNGAGGSVTTSGAANPSSSELVATAGGHGAGIGGGLGGSGGGTVTMNGGGVTAQGSNGGAGVGGGDGASGATVNVNSGTLFAYGGLNAAGIGGGNSGSGGALTIGADGSVTVRDGGGTSSAVGQGSGGASFGSVNNAGGLVVDSGYTLRIPSGATLNNTNTVFNKGTITGAGTLQNDGTVLNTGSIQNNGDGGAGNLTVANHNYRLDFDVNAGPSATPPSEHVWAQTMFTGNVTLPTVSPPTGGFFLGWYTAASGGTQVTTSTDLAALLGSGPTAKTLFAHYRVPQTITFPIIGDQTFGAPDFAVNATASSGLTVTFTAGPASVCAMASATTVHIVAAGSCTVNANQAGNAEFLAAPQVSRSFQVKTGVITVTATGTQTFGGQATFTPSGSLPSGVTLVGSLSCTGLTGNVIIKPSLTPGNYVIDPLTCGGVSLSGSNASNFHMVLQGGTYAVSKANVVVRATGSQVYQGSATFTPVATTPPNVNLSGSLTCVRVNPSTPIDANLAVGSYTIDSSTCSGLSLTGTQAFGYQIAYLDGSYTVSPQPVVVTATGTMAYGASPSFTPQATPPSGITVTGTLSCTKLTGNIPINAGLGVSTYTIDATSCSGVSLSGAGASNYAIKYANGPFTVTKAHVTIVTHTNSVADANHLHKYTFSSTVTNTEAGTPIAGLKVSVTVAFNGTFKATCAALTNASGVATCSSTYFLLFLSPGHAYTATTLASAKYFAGSGSGKLGQ